MDPKLLVLVQATVAIGGIVLAAVFLSDPKFVALFGTVTTFCGALLGNLVLGFNQVSKAKADDMVAKASIRPPSP